MIFRNYNPVKAGDVNAQAFPNVFVYPWIPSQQNVRSNPALPSQPQRIQPTERGSFFPGSSSATGTLAPTLGGTSSSCSGCGGGCGGCGGGMSQSVPLKPTLTASVIATGHSFPVNRNAKPRPAGRIGGYMRSARLPGGATRRNLSGSMFGGR